MSDDKLYAVHDSSLYFTDDELKVMKQNLTDLYKIMKTAFDRPRLLSRPFNSVTHYKIKMQRKYDRPDEFYNFSCEELNIHIQKRRFNTYSVAVSGIILKDDVLKDFEKIDRSLEEHERLDNMGINFFGRFLRSDFHRCVDLFYRLILQALSQRFGLDYKPILRQFEFIF